MIIEDGTQPGRVVPATNPLSRLRQFRAFHIDMDELRGSHLHLLDDYALLVTVGDEPFFTYRFSPELARPCLSPVLGPSGAAAITTGAARAAPDGGAFSPHLALMEPVRSIWIGHGDANGTCFWGDRPDGRIFHLRFTGLEEIPGAARIVTENHWLSAKSELILAETREILVPPASRDLRLIDIQTTFRSEAHEVVFGQSPHGFLGCRIPSISGSGATGRFLSTCGDASGTGAARSRCEWMEYLAEGGASAPDRRIDAIALIDHDGNPRHPPAWRVENDTYGPAFTLDAPYRIPANGDLSLRYLIVLRSSDSVDDQARSLESAVEEIAALVSSVVDPSSTI